MPAPTHAGEVVQQRGRPAQAIRAFHTLLGDNDMLVSLALFPQFEHRNSAHHAFRLLLRRNSRRPCKHPMVSAKVSDEQGTNSEK